MKNTQVYLHFFCLVVEYLVYYQKPKRRTPVSYGGRSSSVPDKSSQRSSRSMSVSPDRVRVRGRSPAFNALAANFENPNARNLSTPPPVIRKLYPKSVTPDSAILAPKSAAIAALSSSFEQPPSARETMIPKSIKGKQLDEILKCLPSFPPLSNAFKYYNLLNMLFVFWVVTM